MRKSRELRAAAREALKDNWLMAICAVFVQSALLSAASGFGLSIFISGPLAAGLSFVFIRLVRDRHAVDLSDLFAPFKGRTLEVSFVAGLLYTLIVGLGMFLFFIPGIILMYSYRLYPYLAAEREDLSGIECLKESRRLMKGYKWRAFCLDLSFIGWYLLVMLTLGLGMILLAPYQLAAQAAFAADRIAADIPIGDPPATEKAAG